MKKTIAVCFLASIAIFFAANLAWAADVCNDRVTVSQIYGGGGNSGAAYKNDFVELYNPTDQNISLENWTVQYATTSGSFTGTNKTRLSGTINAKNYYLVAEAQGNGEGDNLPVPDQSGAINLSATAGKVAIMDESNITLDIVNYSGGSNTKSIYRDFNTCPNTFFPEAPSPKNSTLVETSDETGSGDDATKNDSTKCAISSKDIKLNEIFPYPESGDEFVEIKNTGASCVDVSGWKVMDEAGHKKAFPENSILEHEGFLFLEGNLYLNNDSDTTYLLDANGDAKNDALDKVFYEKAKENHSYALSDGGFSWTSTPTPGEKNIISDIEASVEASGKNVGGGTDTDTTENYSSADGIYLNEILPNPKDGSDNEYIEIANDGNESTDLFGWHLKDASKSKGFQFKEHKILNPGEYLAIYRPDSKITLNNSNESIYLYNPKNELVSSVSFDKSQKDASYNFDGKTWKWSKYLTPGEENKFDSAPTVKITKPKNVFKDIVAEFSARAKDKETKKLKYSWNFGDGKKSNLQKTLHKYLDTGKYTVTLSVTDDSQTVEKSFVINVKNSPRPNLEITKIIPNPAGSDAEAETIDLKNNSNKKINLTGWKIATGSGEKIYNHPISGEISVDPNAAKTITREFSKFSLNNKTGKIQIVTPDGKVVDEIEYAKDKIVENEAYVKIDGEWKWLVPNMEEGGISHAGDDINIGVAEDDDNEEGKTDGAVLGASDENKNPPENYNANFSSENAYIFLTRFGFGQSPTEPNYCSMNDSSFSIAYLLASTL